MSNKSDNFKSSKIISFIKQKIRQKKAKTVFVLKRTMSNIFWVLLMIPVALIAYWVTIVFLTPTKTAATPAPPIVVASSISRRSTSSGFEPKVLETIKGRVRRVVDGDSLYLRGHKAQIRLWGVDAPEKYEAGFQAATNYLKRIAKGKHLECQRVDTDKYSRTIARCFLPNNNEINRIMIESRTAKEYVRFSKGYYKRSR